MAESNAVVEKRQQFAAKQKELAEVFEKAKAEGGVLDTSRRAVLESLGAVDSADAVHKIKQRNLELEALGLELQQHELKAMQDSAAARSDLLNQPFTVNVPHAGAAADTRIKSFGQLFAEGKAFEQYRKGNMREMATEIDIDLKTLMTTSAGWAPQSVRSGLAVEKATRPVQVLDLIPTRPINQAVDKYMAETTRTHNEAEKLEAGTYAEDVFVWTEQTSTVRKITSSIPVTDEQLEDAPEVAAILDQRLRFGLRQRLDLQVMQGDGNAPNLKGIANLSSIQTQAKSTDPVFDAVFKAMMLVRITGRANPSALVFHPTDWQAVRLTRTADGLYIMGNPAEPGPMQLFGLPVALCDSGSAGTAYTGDFSNFSYIGERRGVNVEIGYSSTQFVEGKKTIRADVRVCFTVTREAAFCSITGL